jgi:hypothetical protein
MPNKGTPMPSGYHKISANLSDEVLDVLRATAERENITLTEVLRRAVSVFKVIDDARNEGQQILLRNPKTKEVERVVFH